MEKGDKNGCHESDGGPSPTHIPFGGMVVMVRLLHDGAVVELSSYILRND